MTGLSFPSASQSLRVEILCFLNQFSIPLESKQGRVLPATRQGVGGREEKRPLVPVLQMEMSPESFLITPCVHSAHVSSCSASVLDNSTLGLRVLRFLSLSHKQVRVSVSARQRSEGKQDLDI